jgi:hypothetical protein
MWFVFYIYYTRKQHTSASPHLCGNTCIAIKECKELGRVFRIFKSNQTMFKGIQRVSNQYAFLCICVVAYN